MASFTVASLASLCTSVSHAALSGASELSDVLRSAPNSQHADQLASTSEAIQALSTTVSRLEASINSATSISPRLRAQLGDSLETLQSKLTPLCKQLMRLRLETVPYVNGMFLGVHRDLLVAYTQLFVHLGDPLAMTQMDDQDAALDSPEGRRVAEQATDSSRMLSKAGDILVDGAGSASYPASTGGLPQDNGGHDLPPPYEHSAGSPAASPSGPSNPSASSSQGGGAWDLTSLKQSFFALTSGLRPKPDPLVSALCEASRRGDVGQIAAFLKRGANTDGKNEDGETALHCAILASQESSVRLLLSSGADEEAWTKMPPLFLAASVGNISIARMLLRRGGASADIKKKSMHGQEYFYDVVVSGNPDGVRFLLENGADAKTRSLSGRPAVVQAAKKDNPEMVKLLLDFDASVNSNDYTGDSLISISLDKPTVELMDLLLSRGAKPNSRNSHGERVLAVAISKRKIYCVKRLLEAGADADISDLSGNNLIFKVVKDSKTETEDKVELVRLLLRNGAKATAKDHMSMGQMHILPYVVDKGADPRMAALLMQHGAHSGKTLNNGETPLTHALNTNQMATVHALLENGADPNLPNKHGTSPLMRALVRQDMDLLKLFMKNGASIDTSKNSVREFALTLGQPEILEVLGITPPSGISSPSVGISGGGTQSDAPPGYESAAQGKI